MWLSSSFFPCRGRDWCSDCGAPAPSALIGWHLCPSAEAGRGAASSPAPPLWNPAATQLCRTLSCLTAAFILFLIQQALERQRRFIALPPLLSKLFFVIVVLLLITVPPSPFIPELDRDRGWGGAKADPQRHGATAAQWAEKLLHAPTRQRARAVAQWQGVQSGDPEEGARLHLRPGRRRPQTAVQEGQTSSQTGRAESQAGAASQLIANHAAF